jgi:hypothetical protein
VLKVRLDKLDHKEPLVTLDHLDRLVLMALIQRYQGHLDRLVRRDCLVRLEQLGQLGLLAHKDQQDHKVWKGMMDLLDQRGHKAIPDLLGRKVCQESMEHQVDRKGHKAFQARNGTSRANHTTITMMCLILMPMIHSCITVVKSMSSTALHGIKMAVYWGHRVLLDRKDHKDQLGP